MGTQLPLLQNGEEPPIFSPYLLWPFCREVALSPSDIVLDGDPAPLPKKGEPPIFGPYLLWPNAWMDQDATW